MLALRSKYVYILYSICVYSVMLYGSETWPVKEESLVRLERNSAMLGLRIRLFQRNVGLG